MEHFLTIQGEGHHTGSAAYFIRLGGCDVGCHWCDVKESWPLNAHPHISIESLTELVENSGAPIAVITGGEPTMHSLDELTAALRSKGIKTHIETSGTNPLTGTWDWVTFSPKKFKAPLEAYYKLAHELKVVVFNHSDFQFAEEHASNTHPDCELYLQPEWDKRQQVTPKIVEYITRNPKWKVSLQTHKILQVP